MNKQREPKYKIGDVVQGRFGSTYTLNEFLGFATKRRIKNNIMVPEMKTHYDFADERETNTEHWIGITGRGEQRKVDLKVPSRITNLNEYDETSYTEWSTELWDKPDYLTCSMEEYYSKDYITSIRRERHINNCKNLENTIAFCYSNFLYISNVKRSFHPESKQYKKYCMLEILAFMVYQQRQYPTIYGLNTIKKWKIQNPDITKEFYLIQDEQFKKWIPYEKYKLDEFK